jgi:hypothetical protein
VLSHERPKGRPALVGIEVGDDQDLQ